MPAVAWPPREPIDEALPTLVRLRRGRRASWYVMQSAYGLAVWSVEDALTVWGFQVARPGRLSHEVSPSDRETASHHLPLHVPQRAAERI